MEKTLSRVIFYTSYAAAMAAGNKEMASRIAKWPTWLKDHGIDEEKLGSSISGPEQSTRALFEKEISTVIDMLADTNVSCPLVDTPLLRINARFETTGFKNDWLRTGLQIGVQSAGLLFNAGVTVGASMNPAGPLSGSIASGASFLLSSLTQNIANSLITRSMAIKQFRRSIRMNIVDAFRGLFISKDNLYLDNCNVPVKKLVKLLAKTLYAASFPSTDEDPQRPINREFPDQVGQ